MGYKGCNISPVAAARAATVCRWEVRCPCRLRQDNANLSCYCEHLGQQTQINLCRPTHTAEFRETQFRFSCSQFYICALFIESFEKSRTNNMFTLCSFIFRKCAVMFIPFPAVLRVHPLRIDCDLTHLNDRRTVNVQSGCISDLYEPNYSPG